MTRQDEEQGKQTEERDKSNDTMGNRRVPHLAKISVGTLWHTAGEFSQGFV